jgi:hypothetical protein
MRSWIPAKGYSIAKGQPFEKYLIDATLFRLHFIFTALTGVIPT